MNRLLIIFSLFLPLSVLASDNHYCNDKAVAKEWNDVLLKYPDDHNLRNLVSLRDRLCARVKKGQIPVDAATRQFEDARERLIDIWRKRNDQRMIYIENAA